MKDNHIVTPADHDAGFKVIEVVYRNGRREQINLTAPDYRTAQKLVIELQTTKEVTCVVKAVWFEDAGAALNKLTVESAALIETTAFALTFGSDFQKKMEELGERLQTTMDSTASVPRFPLSMPVIPPGKSADIHCPNCACTIVLSRNTKPSGTSATPTSAPPPP